MIYRVFFLMLATAAVLPLTVSAMQPINTASDAVPADFIHALARYRTTSSCSNGALTAAYQAQEQAQLAYHMAPLAPTSIHLARTPALEQEAIAEAAAAKGCRPIATALWRNLLRRYDGSMFADLQKRAVAGLRALRGVQPPSTATR